MIGTLARLDKATQYFGAQLVFENLSWAINHDARIGLVGPNGAGKSTLLKLLAHELEPSAGSVFIARRARVGYLPQEVQFNLERSVLEEARDASPTLAALEAEMAALEAQMGDPQVYANAKKLARVVERHARAVEQFEAHGGLNFENRVRATLRGLGFSDSDSSLPLAALSGGQKKLVGLAKLLIEQPELLLLDEPDNHLDLNGKQFLEQLIADYPGAVVIVSHDRYLLDIVAEEIAELEDGRLTEYPGNYSEYAFEKKQRLLRTQQLYEVQQREIERLQFSIRRLLGWGSGENEKFVRRARSMQKRLDKLDRIEKPRLERRTIGLDLAAARRGSNKVLEIKELSKAFDGTPVLTNANLLVWHGERVGLIGPNGAGKTVLFRCILGEEQPTNGQVIVGPACVIAYYAQEHETLDYDHTLAEEARRARAMTERELYNFLGRFMFTPDDARKKIRELSGGEKARVQMLKLMLQGANLLLLDEPTNHLDIASAEVLEDALADYDGTLLVISHDRYFLDNVVNRIVELQQGTLTEYLGNYTYYVEEQARRARLRAGLPDRQALAEQEEEAEYEAKLARGRRD